MEDKKTFVWDNIYDWILLNLFLKSEWLQDQRVAVWKNPTKMELYAGSHTSNLM